MGILNRDVCLVFMMLSASLVQAEESASMREWVAASGQLVRARLISHSVETGRIVLKLDESEKDIEMDIGKLSDTDKKYLAAKSFQPEDQRQFEMLGPHLEALRDTPETTIEVLKEIGKNYPTAPYANLWAGVALASGVNKPEEALKEFARARDRVLKQQSQDPSLHRRTLGAILNNMAICQIKLYKPDLAADKFLDALEQVERTPPILAHNIRVLREISENKRSSLEMNESNKKEIIKALARLPIEDPKKKLQLGWYYTLEMDVPFGQGNELSVDGVLPPDVSLELISSGSGIVVAPGYVLTAKPIVMNNMRPSTFATVAVPSTKDRWVLKPARQVIVATPFKQLTGGTTSTSTTRQTTNGNFSESTKNGSNSVSGITSTTGANGYGSNTSGLSSSPMQRSDSASISSSEGYSNTVGRIDIIGDSITNASSSTYKITEPSPGESGAELALLQIEKLGIEPLVFEDFDVNEGEKIAIGGYQRGQMMLKDGIRYTAGELCSDTSQATFTTTALVNGGSRGGPIVNKDFSVLGLAWNQPKDKSSGERSIAFSVDEIRRWLGNHSGTELRMGQLSPDPKQNKSVLEKATVPVFSWGQRQDFSDPMFQKYYNEDSMIDLLVIRDQWCFACKGTSIRTCQNCNSNGRVRVGVEQVPHGQTADGRTLYKPVPIDKACDVCSGRHKIRCNECDGTGRLTGGPSGKPQNN
jgi:tetratricopeptide (TPR) repeat protein